MADQVHEHVKHLRFDVLDDAAPAELEPARINRAVLELVDRADESTARSGAETGGLPRAGRVRADGQAGTTYSGCSKYSTGIQDG
jgi:hypothetical protein